MDVAEVAARSCLDFNDGDWLTDEQLDAVLKRWDSHLPQPAAARPAPKSVVNEACVDGIVYRPGQSVELYDGSFLRITAVLEDSGGEIFFQGRRVWRTTETEDPCLLKHPGECVWVVGEEPSEDVSLAGVKKFVQVHFTNWCIHDTDPGRWADRGQRGLLYCRLKQTFHSDEETSIEFLTYEEADCDHQFLPALLRQLWRGPTTAFGEADAAPLSLSTADCLIDLVDDGEQPPVIDLTAARNNRYTFGDGFCGAGGVSCGAAKAGLAIKWAFDSDARAGASYRLNFSDALCEQSDVFMFLTNSPDFLRVDVSHGSPPCQTFSPAHTVDGPDDDANSACIFACADLIRKAKPRVHTMEETAGLLERHREVFHRVIRDFLEMGYSVRWGILNCMYYGVPQTRRRLVIVVSGPGDALPALPKPTHGLPGSGLSPIETIQSTISRIPHGTADHDVQAALDRWTLRGCEKVPFNANQPACTITCNGGEKNYHPSGRRGFTDREFAALQTFPHSHQFGPQGVRKQIGNAVPPVLAKAIYREVIRSLRRTDQKEQRQQPANHGAKLPAR